MIFNNVTDSLRLWCGERAREETEKASFRQAINNRHSPAFLTFRAAGELAFWLGSLTDVDFPTFQSYCSAVRALFSRKIGPSLSPEPGEFEASFLRRFEASFLEKLSDLSPDCPVPDIPYFRILPEREAFSVKLELSEKWAFEENRHWYPLTRLEIPEKDLFYLPADKLKPYLPGLERLLSLRSRHAYCLEESWKDRPNCFETAELEEYGGAEHAYAAKDFSWLIYFSHENTVTFAGSIVASAEELLQNEKEHWNRWDKA